MGGRLSKKGNISSTVLRPSMSFPHAAGLSSDDATPQLEQPNMQHFGNKCHTRNTLGGYEVYAVDFKYLSEEAIKHILEGNHEVVKMEFQRKNEFSKLVMNYFIYCSSLEVCLKKASKIPLAINDARGQLEMEEWIMCPWRLEEFENFKEYLQTHLMMTQEEISKKLQALNKKVNKRLKSTKSWRKAFTITFAAVSVVVPFTGVATAIVAPPPLAAAQVQAITTLIESIGKWFDSFWKGKEKRLKGKEKVIRSIELNNAGFKDLNTILDQIYKVGIEFESLFQHADMGEDDTMKKMGDLLKKIGDLCKQADMCSSSTGNARKGVLRSMIEDPLN